MLEYILLLVGVISVIIGVVLILKQDNKYNTNNIDEIYHDLSYTMQTTITKSLNEIEAKTNQCLSKIEDKFSALDQRINDNINGNIVNNNVQKNKSKLLIKHQELYNLFADGLSSQEIAMKLNKGVGEVETIISLLKLERDN